MEDTTSLTLLNPHADDFVSTPVSFRLVRRRGLGKYRYLLDEPIRRGRRIPILVDGTMTSLIDQSLFASLPKWLRATILRIEIYFWLRLNGLVDHVEVNWTLDTIQDRSALYVFSYKNCVGVFNQRRTTISAFDHIIINLSHYFIRTREKAENIAKLKNVWLHVDSDLRKNAYFQYFFPNPPPMLVLPFAVSLRFSSKRPFAERSAKCAATGTFHDLRTEMPHAYYRDFIDFFKTNTYHPVRKLLFQHRSEISDWLTSRISLYRESASSNKLGARLRRFFQLDVTQADYFSFDIVDFYNQHRFAIVGEELSGSPAVGFFEGMGCGNVMLGQRGSFYDGLGLEPNVHYLPHDGTIQSIHAAIEQANADLNHASKISKAAISYIATRCSPASVWDALDQYLQQEILKTASEWSPKVDLLENKNKS